MAAKRKTDRKQANSAAPTKLHRLLETEHRLEVMLSEARREAEALVEAARIAAGERTQRLESELEKENHQLRQRIARERDDVIDSIRKESERETTRLDGLDDAEVAALARHVVELLVGRSESRGSC
jgi:vacuolar-type H+-ATPase subunit H